MSKGDTHDDFEFGNDPEFIEKFYKNIDRVLNDNDFSIIEPTDMGDFDPASDLTIASEESNQGEDLGNGLESALDEELSYGLESALDEDLANGLESVLDEEIDEELGLAHGEEASALEDQLLDDKDEEDNADIEDLSPIESIDETLNDINNSLAKQISEELESLESGEQKVKKKSRMMKVQIGVVIGLVVLLGFTFFLGFTKPGNQLLLKMGINIGGKIWDAWTQDFTNEPPVLVDEDYIEEDDLTSDAVEVDTDDIVWPEHEGYGRQEEGVYNILLLGEEAIGSGTSRGRTDLIIIATLNKNSKSIKLTSLMRDTLVQIPGYRENKLNSAYEKGDVELLYKTIALNFNIRLDGCILVNFENFEKIIDFMGGLEITLTSSEARYLRNTNYISNPKYRTVVEGTQLMNGNQVLGYSRIRKRKAITGNNNDYGRTDRHRIILNAIFEKNKTKSEVELATIMFKMLPMVKTDIDSKSFEKLLTTFIEMGTMEVEQLRIPADGTFTDNVKARGMDVLIPDFEKNVSILHEFIFGS